MVSASQTEHDVMHEQDACDDLSPGTKLLQGQYTIVDFLNAGGFGITYRAVDSLDRKVVIKECFPGAFCRRSRTIVQPRSRAHRSEFDGIVRLFVQEARSLSKLQHPNIVGVHQVFEENDTAYMALDFIEGRDLLEILEDPHTDLTPEKIVSILRDILDAVGFVHAQDMLHRDISPDNILVDDSGKPVLIDFGAARQQAQKQSRVLSAMRVVKDGYSPQEFYITGSEQGPFSDLYALGASFYHLIAGEVPPDSQRRLTAIATGDPDPYQPLAGRFPAYDRRVLFSIDQALQVLPADRMQSAAEWLAAMDGQSNMAPAPKAAANAPLAPRRNIGRLAASVAVIAIVAVGGYVVTQTDFFDSDQQDQAVALAAAVSDLHDSLAQDLLPPADIGSPDSVVEMALSTTVAPADPTGVAVRDVPPPERSAPTDATPPTPAPEVAVEPDTTPVPPTDPSERSLAAAEEIRDLPADPSIAGIVDGYTDTAIGWPELGPRPAPEIGVEVGPSITLSGGWSVALPYADLRIDTDGRSRVVGLNGTSVADRAAFDAVLQSDYALSTLETVALELKIGQADDSTALVQSTVLPVVHRVETPDGPTFETIFDNDDWLARVVHVPDGAETDLQVGDVIFASIDTGLRLEGPMDLRRLLESELAKGRQTFSFAVLRDTSNWVASLTLPKPE